MTIVIDRPKAAAKPKAKTQEERRTYRVFLGFGRPRGVSAFDSCGIYERLGEVFERPPLEIYQSVVKLVFHGGEGLMREYLTLDEAAGAVAKASLVVHQAQCGCFMIQEGRFRIAEVK
jgi:hypothetical protein